MEDKKTFVKLNGKEIPVWEFEKKAKEAAEKKDIIIEQVGENEYRSKLFG